MKLIRLFVPICMVSIITLSACAPKEKESVARNWKWKPAVITLTTQGQAGLPANPGKVNLPGNQRCTPAKDGCVRFTRIETGTLEFALAGPQSVRTCSDSGVQGVITKIEFTDSVGIDSEKGAFYASPTTPLPAVLKTQAISTLDLATGEAYFKADYNEGETRVTLININGPGTPDVSGKELWWRVTITKCSDEGLVWVTDPRLVNDGMQ